MNKSDHEEKPQNSDFGSILSAARKSKKYSIEQVSEYLKIPGKLITAIEENDVDALPPTAFVQGYIRAYAKYLEISETEILKIFNTAVPHEITAKLKSRSKLPTEASSQSPVVKMMTILLLVTGIAAVIYGSYQYYQEKADIMEGELGSREHSFTGNSLNSPGGTQLSIRQKTSLTTEDELLSESNDAAEIEIIDVEIVDTEVSDIKVPETQQIQVEKGAEKKAEKKVQKAIEIAEVQLATSALLENDIQQKQQQQPETDTIEIIAEKGAWLEVTDAAGKRLFYNMMPVASSRTLYGKAPFRVSLGNAKSTQIAVNDIVVDLSAQTRQNNTASFTVSIEGQKAVFR